MKITLNSCEKGILYLSNVRRLFLPDKDKTNDTHFFKKRRSVIQEGRRKENFHVMKTSSENFLLQKGK